MEDLASFAARPLAFFWRFVRRHRVSHAVILGAVAGVQQRGSQR